MKDARCSAEEKGSKVEYKPNSLNARSRKTPCSTPFSTHSIHHKLGQLFLLVPAPCLYLPPSLPSSLGRANERIFTVVTVPTSIEDRLLDAVGERSCDGNGRCVHLRIDVADNIDYH